MHNINDAHYSVAMARRAGIKPAIFFECLLQSKEPLGEWICFPEKFVEQMTTLTRKEQDNAIKKLKDIKLIEAKLKGIPAKRHFKINE